MRHRVLTLSVLFLCIISSVHAQLYVNEVMSGNSATITDEDGTYADWLELYNSGPTTIDIEGYYLTDTASNLTKWQVHNKTIGAGQFLLVFASNKNRYNTTYLHTNFAISGGGEPVILTAPDGTTIVDSLPATVIPTDKTFGRVTDGGTTALLAAPTPGATNVIAVPPLALIFSKAAGVSSGAFNLTLNATRANATIRYTLDGSTPTASSTIYTGPILITNNSGKPNNISMINETSPRWTAPNGEVLKATVVRAYATDGNETTPVATSTYIVDATFTVPILSVTTNWDNLFDYTNGIYLKGKMWDDAEASGWQGTSTFHPANYRNDSERLAHLEMFEQNGTRVLNQDVGLQISGQGSRVRQQKSLRFYSRSEYGSSAMPYQVFPDSNITSYRRLTLRNPDDDNRTTFLRDALAHKLVQNTSLAIENYRPVVAFVNGEYWGLYPLREKANQHYLESHYGVDKDNVVILEDNAVLDEGAPGDEQPYLDLVDYAIKNDLRDPVKYSYVQNQMDTESFARYYALETFIGNTDWPSRNVELWRLKVAPSVNSSVPYGSDGRWRWVLHDGDYAFGYAGQGVDYDMFAHIDKTTWGGALWRSLAKNEQFRDDFVSISADQLRTNLATNNVISAIDSLSSVLMPELQQQFNRWTTISGVSQWQQNIESLRQYARDRPAYQREHIAKYFGLGGIANLTVTGDGTRGVVQANTINVSTTSTGTYFKDVPITLTAYPKPGKVFLGWTGAASGTSPIMKIVLSSDTTVGAVFADAAGAAPSGAPIWVTRKYPATYVTMTQQQNVTLLVELENPSSAPVNVTWFVDGSPVAASGLSLVYAAATQGNHSVDVVVTSGSTTLMQHWLITVQRATGQVCYNRLADVPATCTGGIITQDTVTGCRKIVCGSGPNSLTALACEKPTSNNPLWFEVYKQTQTGSGVTICLGAACVGNSGFAQANLPLCIDANVSRNITFTSTNPSGVNVSLLVGQTQLFNYTIDNPAGLPVGSKWYLENVSDSLSEDLSAYEFTAFANGTYNLTLQVSSNETNITRSWRVLVGVGNGSGNGTGNETGNGTGNQTVCYNSVQSIPANCTGGSITTDTYSGCRTIVCTSGASSLQILACDKTGFFEMYRQTQVGAGVGNICIDGTCIGNNGYAKSSNFPICSSTGNGTGNQTNTTTNYTLTVLSSPSANLSINGISYGSTPNALSFVSGAYTVNVSIAGYAPNSTTVNLVANTTVNLTLHEQSNGSSNQTVCYNSVQSIPANCTGGSITTDTYSGCRTIVCTSGASSLQILACDKTGFFEMYRQTQVGAGVGNICIDGTCIGNNGYAKSSNFPICVSTGNATNSTGNDTGNQTNTTTNYTLAVTSAPLGELTINGTSYGSTPANVSLVSGIYAIAVSAVNYTTNSTTITLNADTTLVLTLQPVTPSNGTGNESNTTNVTTSAAMSIAPWFPQGRSYVFLCNATGFTSTSYDYVFGDGNKQLGSTRSDVYYTYSAAGAYNVTCTAKAGATSAVGTLAVTVA